MEAVSAADRNACQMVSLVSVFAEIGVDFSEEIMPLFSACLPTGCSLCLGF